MIEYLLWILATASILAVGALIGDHIIPAIVKSISGKPQQRRQDYAEKDWIKTLTSYEN